MNCLTLARLLQLASQAFPIGAYSHSQGLESAIEQRIVADEASALSWITQVLEFSMMSYEIPRLIAMGAAWANGCPAELHALNEEFLATRETSELRSATVQMGYSMRSVLYVLGDVRLEYVEVLRSMEEPSLPCVWSAVCAAWQIDARESAVAYLWSWAENQVMAAIKAVPLGQSAGQRMLCCVGGVIGRALAHQGSARDGELSNFTPALAILCAQHETQYSRLFRS